MRALLLLVIILVVPVFFVLLFVISAYNKLVTLRNRFKNAYAQIDVQLRRRYDLIPNLVETAKGYMKFERETLEAVISARNAASAANVAAGRNPGGAAAMKELATAETNLSGVLGRLFALSEAYPDLKANQNFLALQEELASTENKIGFARQYFNDAVLRLNNMIQMFPSNILAGMFGFQQGSFFEVTDAAQREAPKVSF